MKRILFFAAVIAVSVNAYASAAENVIAEGNTIVTKSNPIYNINPFDPAKIEGVGQNGTLTALTPEGRLEIELGAPLMKINDAYVDRICFANGKWGVMRGVGKMVFDGSENWAPLENYRYKNDKTQIYTLPIDEKILVENGMCTYFDVVSDSVQKTYIYDAVSVGPNNNSINMRFMNVRGIGSTEQLKQWLKGKHDAGTPVVFYYALNNSAFEPFDEKTNEFLNRIDSKKIVFADLNIAEENEKTDENSNTFFNDGKAEGFIENFKNNVKMVKVYGGNEHMGLYIDSYEANDRGLVVKLKDSGENSNVYTGEIAYGKIDFMSKKNSEITFESETSKAVVKIQVYFYGLVLPTESGSGYTYDETGLKPVCYVRERLILPDNILSFEGEKVELYLGNAIANRVGEGKNDIKAGGGVSVENGDKISFDAKESFGFPLKFGSDEYEINVVSFEDKPLERDIKVMLLGDSLINEDKYPRFLGEMLGERAKLVGTRGSGSFLHEGRGGWAIYDYCNSESKYGYTNPFLNNGKFDFSYYMKNNGFENVDYVVVNLGINDLNLIGHNDSSEILSYFDSVIKSIFEFDPDTKIVINTPIMLFDTNETVTAKNARLEFIEKLNEKYGSQANEGIFFSPSYIMLDPYMDFKLKEPVMNDENQNGSFVVTDTTHPADSGYKKIAESTYKVIKFAESISGLE
ncbi:MAG: hypothetical protein HFE62_05705 [Firmicutes bacterium]|nr:hypothetical protein [Bacillota bacterium]